MLIIVVVITTKVLFKISIFYELFINFTKSQYNFSDNKSMHIKSNAYITHSFFGHNFPKNYHSINQSSHKVDMSVKTGEISKKLS